MKRIVILIVTIVLIIGFILGFFLLKNKEVDDWIEVDENEDLEEYVFKDIPKSYWASQYILYVTQRQIMFSDDNDFFYPDKKMLLKDFLITILKASMPRLETNQLSDKELINLLQEKKILGEDFKEEKLNNLVTNYDALILLAKIDIKIKGNPQKMIKLTYQDLEKMNVLDKTLIGHSIASGFFNAPQTLNLYLDKELNRAEIAEIIYLFLNH